MSNGRNNHADITIFKANGQAILTVPLCIGSKRVKSFDSDYINLKFSLADTAAIGIGCYCDVRGQGRFVMSSEQRPTYNPATDAYDYDITFDAHYRLAGNRICFFSPKAGREASWSLTATPDVFLQLIIDNLNAQGRGLSYLGQSYTFAISFSDKESYKAGMAKLITASSLSITGLLDQMAQTWECEWWCEGNIFYFGRCEFGVSFDIEPGRNAQDLTPSASKGAFANRYYIFGGESNIPTNYRDEDYESTTLDVIKRRLMLPPGTNFIDAWRYARGVDGSRVIVPVGSPGYASGSRMDESEVVEGVIVIDDVYPRTRMSITAVEEYEAIVEETDPTTGEAVHRKETFYRFRVSSDFIFNDSYILEGQELRCAFQIPENFGDASEAGVGKLSGMEFALRFNPNAEPVLLPNGDPNPAAQLYEIIASEDYGRKLPDETLKPSVGDEIVLIGWDVTKMGDLGLLAKAENELLKRGEEAVALKQVDPNTYECRMMSDWVFKQGHTEDGVFLFPHSVGQRVRLVSPACFVNGYRESRIVGIEYPLDIPYDTPVYTIGETASYSRMGDLQSQIDALTMGGVAGAGVNGSGGQYLITSTDNVTAPSDRNVYSALRSRKEFLNKTRDDTSVGKITSTKGVQVHSSFLEGWVGHGGKMWYDTKSRKTILEADILRAREAMEAPEFRFNRIDVVAGEQWQTFAFGKVTKVEKSYSSGRCWIELVDDELLTFKPADIVRGIFHGMTLTGASSDANVKGDYDQGIDECGFQKYAGFYTSYLTPTQLIDEFGNPTDDLRVAKGFKYALRPGDSRHPCAGMKLVAYGNFKDESRQSTVYATRTRLTMMEKVDTWTIDPTLHFTYIRGDLNNITIGSTPLSGHGVMMGRSYLYEPSIHFKRETLDALKGSDAYSVHLTSETGVVRLDADGRPEALTQTHWVTGVDRALDPETGKPYDDEATTCEVTAKAHGDKNAVVTEAPILTTAVQVHKGSTVLLLANDGIPAEGTYTLSIIPLGCEARLRANVVEVTKLTDTSGYAHVNIVVNCEGEAKVIRQYAIAVVKSGKSGESVLRLELTNENAQVLIDKEGEFALPDSYYPLTRARLFYGTKQIDIKEIRILSIDIHDGYGEETAPQPSIFDGDWGYYLWDFIRVQCQPGYFYDNPMDAVVRVTYAYGQAPKPDGSDIDDIVFPYEVTFRIVAISADNPNWQGEATWTVRRRDGDCIYELYPREDVLQVSYDEDENPFYVQEDKLSEWEGELYFPCDIIRIDREGAQYIDFLPDYHKYRMLYRLKYRSGDEYVSEAWDDARGGFGALIGETVDPDLASITFKLSYSEDPDLFTDDFDVDPFMLDRETVPVICDGRAGKAGERGLPGCMLRRWTSIAPGQIFNNDIKTVESDEDAIGYVDFLMFRVPEYISSSGWLVFQCVADDYDVVNGIPFRWQFKGESSTSQKSLDLIIEDGTTSDIYDVVFDMIGDGTYNSSTKKSRIWREVDINAASGFFNFLIANHADIDILSGNQFLIRDNRNNVVGGMQGCRSKLPVIWAGADQYDPGSAPVRIYAGIKTKADGSAVLDDNGKPVRYGNAYVEGEVMSGKADSQHITLNPEAPAVEIFNDDGVLCTTLSGKTINPIMIPSGGDMSKIIFNRTLRPTINGIASYNLPAMPSAGIVRFAAIISGTVTLQPDYQAAPPTYSERASNMDFNEVRLAGHIQVDLVIYDTTYATVAKKRVMLWGATNRTSEDYAASINSETTISFSCEKGHTYMIQAESSSGGVTHTAKDVTVQIDGGAVEDAYNAIFGSNGFIISTNSENSFAIAKQQPDPNPDIDYASSVLRMYRNGIHQPFTIFAARVKYTGSSYVCNVISAPPDYDEWENDDNHLHENARGQWMVVFKNSRFPWMDPNNLIVNLTSASRNVDVAYGINLPSNGNIIVYINLLRDGSNTDSGFSIEIKTII